MSIAAFLFRKKSRRPVVADPVRSDGRAPAPRLLQRQGRVLEDAYLFEAFASGACDDAIFASLASLRGLNVAERERSARSCPQERGREPSVSAGEALFF